MNTYNMNSINMNSFNNNNNQVRVFNTQFIRTNKAQNIIHYQFLQWLEQKEPTYRKKQREEFVNSNYIIIQKKSTFFSSTNTFLNTTCFNNQIQQTKTMNNNEREFLLLSDYLEMKGILIRNDNQNHQYNQFVLKEISNGIEYPIFTWPMVEENYEQNIQCEQNPEIQNMQENMMNEEIIVDQQINYNNDINYNQINPNEMNLIRSNEQNIDTYNSTNFNNTYQQNNDIYKNEIHEFNWIIDTENFLRKQCILESSRVWDIKPQWNFIRCNKGAKQLLLHTQYYLNPEVIKVVENIELGEYLHERYSPQNYIEVNSMIYQTYTIFECIDILEMIFGKYNIMLGYIWEQIENTIKYTIRLYISDIRSYALEYTFVIPNNFIINGNLMTESTKPIFYHITEKAILSALLLWFPFLKK